MSNLKRVFIIEADMGLLRRWMEEFNGRVVIIFADSPTMAENTLVGDVEIREKLRFDLIVVAPQIRNGALPRILELITFMRDGPYQFTGPIVASTDDPYCRDNMIRAGADHNASQQRIPAKVLKILSE
jgi:hypothetical protein